MEKIYFMEMECLSMIWEKYVRIGTIDNSSESFESNSYTKYDEVLKMESHVWGHFEPLQETNEEESQS